MKHVDHIINEREVLQFLSDRSQQFMEELQRAPNEGDDDLPITSECPFLMDIYSSF